MRRTATVALAIPGTRRLDSGVCTACAKSADATATATGTMIILLTATPARDKSPREERGLRPRSDHPCDPDGRNSQLGEEESP